MNAFLFLWNPQKDPNSFLNFENIVADANAGIPYETRWICPSRQPQRGDLAYVQRTGAKNNGVFAKGLVMSSAFDNDGIQVVELRLNSFLPIDSELSRPEITDSSKYDKTWSPMSSGNLIPDDILTTIDSLWEQRFSQKIHAANQIADELNSSRHSENYASAIIEKIIPSHKDRAVILGQLLKSINIVEQIAPNIFSLTLFEDGFRLNVGPVEVLTYAAEYPEFFEIRLLCHGTLSSEISEYLYADGSAHAVIESDLKSVPKPQFVYSGLGKFENGSFSDTELSCQKIKTAINLLTTLHTAFIDQAAKTPSGKVRRSSNLKRYDSPGLYLYAKSFLAAHTTSKNEVIDESTDEDSIQPNQYEGKKYSVIASRYERNPQVREDCLAHYGYSCSVCGFNFADSYGEAAKDYIHVHHLTPLASNGEQHEVDHVHDLRPVCANCHAVIHLRRAPDLPYSIEEVKNMRKAKQGGI